MSSPGSKIGKQYIKLKYLNYECKITFNGPRINPKDFDRRNYFGKIKSSNNSFRNEKWKYDTQIAIDFINDNIPLLNGFMPGEEVQVSLNITGNVSKTIPIKYIIISAVGKLNEWRVNLIVSNKTICDKRRSLLTILDFRICLRGIFPLFF